MERASGVPRIRGSLQNRAERRDSYRDLVNNQQPRERGLRRRSLETKRENESRDRSERAAKTTSLTFSRELRARRGVMQAG